MGHYGPADWPAGGDLRTPHWHGVVCRYNVWRMIIDNVSREIAPVSLPAVEVSQTPENKYREYLSSRVRPQRYTDQQRDMVRYIFAQHNHFDADQLVDDMKRA